MTDSRQFVTGAMVDGHRRVAGTISYAINVERPGMLHARLLRSNLIETMGEDYIRTARAKGLSERRVVLRHGVRSAITPIVTAAGLDIGILLGGAILTESVFNIPGIGRLVFDALQRSDLPMIQGTVLLGTFFIVVANLIVDIAYAFLDPRVRYS